MKNTMINLIALLLMLALAGCAHESKIQPSTGHIDDQQTKSAAAVADIPKPIKSTPYVPPPKAKAKEQTYSVVVNEVPVKEVLFALARESKLNIDIHPSIRGKVTLNAVDQTLPAILERLAKQVDLTYRLEGNVLNIGPDQPVLRSYKVDYVNMARDTSSSIGAAAEIATAGRAAAAGAQSGGAAGSGGGLSSNGSRTQVSSESKNHFWGTLIQNIKDILAETDKEVIIGRNGGIVQSETQPTANIVSAPGGAAAAPQATNQAALTAAAAAEREEDRKEYKTLFAATVIANPEAGVISVRGTNKQHEKVQEFLDRVLTSAKKQVLIEATIVEVELKDEFNAGIDWSRLGNGLTFQQSLQPTVTDPLAPATLSSFVAGYAYTGSGILADLKASIKLLQQFGNTKVLSSPKLMVLNNQTAVLKVVDNLVYFTIEAETTQGQTTQNITFTSTPQTVPVGIVMSVTPQINDGSSVMLNVRPTITRFLTDVQDPNPSLLVRNAAGVTTQIASRVPVIQVREMESILRVESGDTTVLGGLMQDDIKNNTDVVPGLSRIPLVGNIFKGKADLTKKTELVIFLRPTVISSASLESDELRTYKQYMPTQQLQHTDNEPVN